MPRAECDARRLRVALLTNIPTPYRVPFYRALGNGCDLHVVFDAESESNRRWHLDEAAFGFEHSYAKGATVGFDRVRPLVSDLGGDRAESALPDRRFLQLRIVLDRLARMRPDVIITAEFGTRTLQAVLYGLARGIPVVMWWEGTRHTEGWVDAARRAVRRALVRAAARYWSNGLESSALLVDYGARPDRIDAGMTGVDTAALRAKVVDALTHRDEVRASLGVAGVTFLFIGQFTPRKGLSQFTAAADELTRRGVDGWSAVFLGGGLLDGELRAWAAQQPGGRVVVHDFVQPDRVPTFLAAADVFVLPTLDDNWSLAVLEALTAGLPQVFSPYNGGTADLARHPRAGRVADPLDVPAFADALEAFVRDGAPRLSDAVVRSAVEYYGTDEMAARALRSLHAAVAGACGTSALATHAGQAP